MKARFARDVFGRWFIVSSSNVGMAWSGSHWVPHVRGIGLAVQISNFETIDEARQAAKEQIK